jgi:hypothetical protein
MNTAASISLSQINLTAYFTNGNVGINTTNPSAKLDVSGTIRASGLSSLATITTGTISATNVVGNTISAGTLIGTTITGANMSLSGNLSVAGTLTTVNITSTNLVQTNVSTGTIYASGTSTLQNVTLTNASASTIQVSGTNDTQYVPSCVFANNSTVAGAAVASFLTPNMPTPSISYSYFGKSLSSGNSASISYNYVGNNNEANYISLNNYGKGGGLFLLNNGNVGIGTLTPLSSLHVSGTMPVAPSDNGVFMGVDTSNNYGIQLNSGSNGSANAEYIDFGYNGIDYVSRIISFNADRNLAFYVNSNVAASMTIQSTGNIGIGTNSPSTRLHVSNNSGNTMTLQNITNNDNACLELQSNSFTTYIGLGNPASVFSNNTFIQCPKSLQILVNNGATTAMFMNTSGNIGIGTNSPSYKLDVAGTGRFGASGATSTILTSNRINSLGYMINANTVGNSVTTNVNVINKRVRVSRAIANSAVSTWTTRSFTTNGYWPAICWSSELGLFVAGNNSLSSSCQTSPDGITWTARTLGTSIQAWDVIYCAELSLFVMTSSSSTTNPFRTSPDGITWTTRTTASAYSVTGICWSPELGIFVACAGAAGALVSSDGTSWTAYSISGSAIGNQRVCWSSELGIFVMTNNANGFFYSNNGTSWTSVSFTSIGLMQSICWSPELGIFVTGGNADSTSTFATSPDAINWTVRTSPVSSQGPANIIWSPELSLFITASGSYTFSSSDGITWTTRSSSLNSTYSCCWSPELSVFAITSNAAVNQVYISKPGIPSSKNTILAPDSQLSINNLGNVGIGANNPAVPLTFSDTLGDKISLYSNNTVANFGFGIQGSLLQIHSGNVGDDIAFGYGASSYFTERMRIKGSGNVGIGTNSPTYKLDVAGDIRTQSAYLSYNGFLDSLGIYSAGYSHGTSIQSRNAANTSNKVLALNPSGGNVGVGTTSPTTTFHVNGAVTAGGNVGFKVFMVTGTHAAFNEITDITLPSGCDKTAIYMMNGITINNNNDQIPFNDYGGGAWNVQYLVDWANNRIRLIAAGSDVAGKAFRITIISG